MRIVLTSLQTSSTGTSEVALSAISPVKSLKLSLYPAIDDLGARNTWGGVADWENNVYVQALNDDLKWGTDDPDSPDNKTVLSYYIYDDETFFDEDVERRSQ